MKIDIDAINIMLDRIDHIERAYVIFAQPSDLKHLKELIPDIEKRVVLHEVAYVEPHKLIIMKRSEFEKYWY